MWFKLIIASLKIFEDSCYVRCLQNSFPPVWLAPYKGAFLLGSRGEEVVFEQGFLSGSLTVPAL